VVFDETIQKPHMRGNYTGKIDASNPYVREALALFDYGLSLRNAYSDWDRSLPNPEEFACKNAYYVERTNGIFVSAMNFILYHEVAHNYYGHFTYTPPTSAQSKKEEFDADNFALDYILSCGDKKIQQTLKYGTVVALCSILLLDSQLNGGYYHPDSDDRIKNALEKLDLKDLDLQWGIASLAFRLWGNHFGITYSLPPTHMNYKELFYQTLAEVDKTKP
jgi:hypothetical protein